LGLSRVYIVLVHIHLSFMISAILNSGLISYSEKPDLQVPDLSFRVFGCNPSFPRQSFHTDRGAPRILALSCSILVHDAASSIPSRRRMLYAAAGRRGERWFFRTNLLCRRCRGVEPAATAGGVWSWSVNSLSSAEPAGVVAMGRRPGRCCVRVVMRSTSLGK